MTSCTTGPNGGRCHVCVVWDAQAERIRQAETERQIAVDAVQFWQASNKGLRELHAAILESREAAHQARTALLRAELDEVQRGR